MSNKQTTQTQTQAKENKQRQPDSAEQTSPASALLAGLDPMSLGDLPNHPTTRPLRQSHLLQLQKQHGNAYAQRHMPGDMVAREGEFKKGLEASMLTVNIQETPNTANQMKTEKSGEGLNAVVKFSAPEIKFKAKVGLVSGTKIGPGEVIRVGPIQTMTSSVRTGVYKKGDKVVAELSTNLSNVRDARPYPTGDGGFYAPERPFYDKPESITDDRMDADISFIDRPTMTLPQEFGGGRLAAVKGADQFNTSVGAKRDSTIITMNPFGWKVDWTMDLTGDYDIAKNDKGESTAKGISTWEEKAGIVVDTDSYAHKILKETPFIFSFATVEAAMTESAPSLWIALPAAMQHDPTSAQNIIEALKQKKPNFAITLKVQKAATYNVFSANADTIEVFAKATKQCPNKGPFTIEEGKQQTITVALDEIVDLSAVQSGSMMSIWAGGDGILGDFLELPYPFLSSGTINVTSASNRGGVYQVNVTMS